LSLRARLDEDDQHLRNIDSAKAWLEASDQGLDGLEKVLERARTLALSGASQTMGPGELKAMATEVDQLLQEALQLANSKQDNQYLFAGLKTTTTPFTLQEGSPDTVTYNGDSGQMLRQTGPDTAVAVNVTGEGPLLDLFAALIGLRDDLEAGNSSQIGSLRLQSLDNALDSISSLRGRVGAKISGLEVTAQRINDFKITLQSLLSKAEDVDMAEAAMELATAQTAYQAVLAVGSQAIKLSLVDFMK
jgi:flagellar hook-associated protein 3 FlgL